MLTRLLSTKLTPATTSVLLILLYNDWMLAPLLNPAMSTRVSLISEISARTQPYHWVFQTLDILGGVLVLALLPCLFRLLQKRPAAWRWLLFIGVGLIGADSIIDASLPISCAPSLDVHCTLGTFRSYLTDAHMIESSLVGVVTFITPLLWWFHFRKTRALLAQSSGLFVLLQLGVGLGVMLAHRNETAVVGLLQRFYELNISTWLAVVIGSSIRAAQKHRANRKILAHAVESLEAA
ncbi:MAG TPA: DUF998 domain-containing protein [Candidatus Saccharimonadales bacterium]|nr:DUF998 domain-containing protein [Candidatus Saccharimonadales bacterium]